MQLRKKAKIFLKRMALPLAHISGSVENAAALHLSDSSGWKPTCNRYSVDTSSESIYPLPFGHPRIFGAHQTDHAVEIRTCEVVNVVSVVLHPEKLVTIIAAVEFELVEGFY